MLAVLLGVWLLAYAMSALYQVYKPLPDGLSVATPLRTTQQVRFLVDESYQDAHGRQSQQQIFDTVLSMIANAQRLIVLDMFLFNDEVGKPVDGVSYRPLTAQITDALIAQKKAHPDMSVVFITDPINTVYGGTIPTHVMALRRAGVAVVETNLVPLRASNPVWSGVWYLCCQGVGNNAEAGWLANPFGADKITLRSYLALLNFKANHRKTVVVDTPTGWQGLVTSANPHDASSWHDNVALQFDGQAALDLLNTERAVAKLSGVDFPFILIAPPTETAQADPAQTAQLQILTESKIKDAVLASMQGAVAGDQLDISMFYLSYRAIVRELIQAQTRGVHIRVLLDSNQDAFGRKKNGIPNRQVAHELQQSGVPIRWCNTHGEQCHSKMLIKTTADGHAELILGSANYTRRNLNDLNLESNVRLLASAQYEAVSQAQRYFDHAWHNQAQQQGQHVDSVAYATYQDGSALKYWWYRFAEWSGLSTF